MTGKLSLLALATLLIGPGAAAPLAAAPPLAAYGQLPTVGDIVLSPDGTRWAAIVGAATGSEVQVREIATGKLLLASPAKDYKLRALQWAGNDAVVLTLSQTARVTSADFLIAGHGEFFQLLMYKLTDHKWHRLMNNMLLTSNFVAGPPVVRKIDGRPQLVVEGFTPTRSDLRPTLFRIDTVSARAVPLEAGVFETTGWIIGLDGKPVARADYDRKSGDWRLQVRSGEFWKELYRETAPVDQPYLVGLGRTPGTILVASHKSGEYETYEFRLSDGSWSPSLKSLDADGLVRDPMTLQPIGAVDVGLGSLAYEFWNPDDQKSWQSITRSFKDELVRLVDWSDDRNIVMVEVFGAKSGDAIYVIDRNARAAGLLSQRYAAVGAADLGPVQTLTYKAADGTMIPAYLTLPPGRPAHDLPLVVLPHGGPAASDTPGFDWWAQALASRGYAVLQPQFRGSTGFGEAHLVAGYGQWGRKMQTDLSDGVRHLASLGTIDAKRVCIVGASYGGYAALAGLTVEQGVYRCAASIAGVSDLRRMLQRAADTSRGVSNPEVRYWERFMGAGDAISNRIDTWSPAHWASRVTAPLLLIHGKDDLVVPMEQSSLMLAAMKRAGKPVEMVVLPSEDHWLSRPATRIAMLEALMGFLEKHNPPAVAPAAAP